MQYNAKNHTTLKYCPMFWQLEFHIISSKLNQGKQNKMNSTAVRKKTKMPWIIHKNNPASYKNVTLFIFFMFSLFILVLSNFNE